MKIEKKYFNKLPDSYQIILKNNIKINSLIDVKVKEINKYKNKIFNLNTELNSILNKRDSLNNKLLFIERNYIPKIYFKTYFKKSNPNIFSHIVIKYLNKSKTVYFGKIDDLIICFLIYFPALNVGNFKKTIIPILSSLIADDLFHIKTEADFIKKKYSSIYFKELLSNHLNMNSQEKNHKVSFSDYLKSLK